MTEPTVFQTMCALQQHNNTIRIILMPAEETKKKYSVAWSAVLCVLLMTHNTCKPSIDGCSPPAFAKAAHSSTVMRTSLLSSLGMALSARLSLKHPRLL